MLDYSYLKNRIKEHEGFRDQIYQDPLGKETIGYGHLITAPDFFEKGKSYDTALLDEIFDNDFQKAVTGAQELLVGIDLSGTAKEVIIEMVFQLGRSGVSKFNKMFEALRSKDYNRAADEMLKSLWHEQTPHRCRELSNIMRKCGLQ